MNENALIYEYAVVRYVPRVEREEFVNVGLLMMCKRRRWLRSEMRLDPARIKGFDPEADLAMLGRQLGMFDPQRCALAGCTAEEKFRWLSAVKSSVIQTSRPHPGLVECDSPADAGEVLDRTFERLLGELVL